MIHRVDPLVHTSRKGIIKTAAEKKHIQEKTIEQHKRVAGDKDQQREMPEQRKKEEKKSRGAEPQPDQARQVHCQQSKAEARAHRQAKAEKGDETEPHRSAAEL